MKAWNFTAKMPKTGEALFDELLRLFQDLLIHTSGDVDEAISWLTELDKHYQLTTSDYGISDFIEDLIEKGFLRQNQGGPNGDIPLSPTPKMDLSLHKFAMKDLFGKIKKSKHGKHSSNFAGTGDEQSTDLKPFEFGDNLDRIAFSESIHNAYINHGIDDFKLNQEDLEVQESLYQSSMSTVLMIDISHSMILYGEDRITPAKKVAMALAQYITTQYPKDTIDVLTFGNDAQRVKIKDLPYLQVGPFHTNTVAGLEMALEMLKKRRNSNKQIFMITDGKPTCIKKGKKYYKNSWGLDKQIIGRTLNLAGRCRKLDIPITTFMIAKDPYLVQFVEQFTEVNQGKAYFSGLDGLGDFVFSNYKSNRKNRNK